MRHKAAVFAWLFACVTWAQEVAVLEFQADFQMRLREQIEDAVLEYTTLRPMPLQTYKNEALRLGIAHAQTTAGFSQAAAHLKGVVVAVGGKVEGQEVEIFIWDRAGVQLWSRRLPLVQGLLTKELSQRLANAIAAAVGVQTEAPQEAPDTQAVEPLPRPSPPLSPAHTAELPAAEGEGKEEGAPGPPPEDLRPQTSFLQISLQGTSTWRSLCIRPGRDDCLAFEKWPEGAPQGNQDFSSGAYAGAFFQAAYFPLVLWTPSLWQGVGLRLEAGYGRAKRGFVDAGPSSQAATLTMQEAHWAIEALYRHFFLTPSTHGMGLQASASLGYAGKAFSSKNAWDGNLLTPDIRRHSMSVGLETELSLSFIRFSLYGSVFVQPKPGSAVFQEYGNVRSQGYKVGGAVSGVLYGPLGYKVDMSWNFFKDSFADKRWPEGGLLRETYLALRGGLLLEF